MGHASRANAAITCFTTILEPLAGRESHPGFFTTDEDTYATEGVGLRRFPGPTEAESPPPSKLFKPG